MNEPAIRRYERALGREIKGFRRRKEVRKSFHRSLALKNSLRLPGQI